MGAQTIRVAAPDTEIRLDRWFKRHYPELGHAMIERLLRTGQIKVDGKKATSSQRIVEGQEIRVPPIKLDPARATVAKPSVADAAEIEALHQAILYRDEDVLVINKPAGLAVQGGTGQGEHHLDALLDGLRFEAPDRPRLVHRLDKDTSGVLVLGRSAAATAKLAAAFRSRDARKCYWALVVGVPHPRMGRISAPLAKMTGRLGDKVEVDEEEGKHAVTWYRVVDNVLKKAAWLELEPRTGRTHQLRAHCLLLKTPILGDGKYGGAEAFLAGQGISRKLHLHARTLRVPHPRQGILEVTAPLPAHMKMSFEFFGFDTSQAGPPFTSFDEN